MTWVFAVIGAGYGDEGKGRNVDALCRQHYDRNPVVVRSNGGAQAGHTVVDPVSGERHVFHHFGSGALAGARTHLSRFFVHHPMMFMEEREQLLAFDACISVSADPRGYVTTPWDMMVNQIAELSRGESRHGSCGMGFGETVGRNEETRFTFVIADIFTPYLEAKLRDIRDAWLPMRMEKLGLVPDDFMKEMIASEAILQRFLIDCREFASLINLEHDRFLRNARMIVFESAQGLLLDQNAPTFPYVTRSNTGIQNISSICQEANLDDIKAIYATRCYLTRHGAGPMHNERDISEFFDTTDKTNIPNPWQQSLRFGLIDFDQLKDSILLDLEKSRLQVSASIAVSCLDQAFDLIPFIQDGMVTALNEEDFVQALEKHSGICVSSTWKSPANQDSIIVA
jgi:adenylosuccinate synthase